MRVVRRDVFVFFGDFIKYSPPEIMRKCQHVCLAAKRQLLSLIALSRVLKCVADAALDAGACIARYLQRGLIFFAFIDKLSLADIKPFIIFAHDHKIDILRTFIAQRRPHTGIKLHRAQIDVLLQIKADL